jgi:hypothetical protein
MVSLSARADTARPRSRRIGAAYVTALCAALPLALLDGGMAALVGDLTVEGPFDLVRFAAFVTGIYAILALALATLEIPFVMLLGEDVGEDRADRAAKGYAAAIAVAIALAPLEPLAVSLRQSFARTSFAALALLLAGIGLALGALLVFAVLERALGRLLRRARGTAGRALASPAAGLLAPVAAIAAWAALVGADVLDPGSREAVSLAATALAVLAIQGGIAWLARTRAQRLAQAGAACVLLSAFGIASLADGVARAPGGDPAVTAATHQTLLGSFLLPTLRQGLGREPRGPAILPPSGPRRTRPSPPVPRPFPAPRAERKATTTAPATPRIPTAALAAASTAPTHAQDPSQRVRRNLVLVTFDAFEPDVFAMPEAGALQLLAARALQVPARAPGSVPQALRQLFGEGPRALGASLAKGGYETVGLFAWNARGRGRFAPEGFDQFRLIGGSADRYAADAVLSRARALLRTPSSRPLCLWLHLPGPTGRSPAALRAAAQRAGTRLGWLLRTLERMHIEDRTVVAVVGLPARPGADAVALLALPGGAGERSAPVTLRELGERLRTAASGR